MTESRATAADRPVLLGLATADLSASAAAGVRAASVLFVAALTAAAAQVSVPLPWTPVPFTLQPMVVLLGAAVLGGRLGASAQVLYLLAGIAGLPVFAASPVLPPGAARLLGPTAGFLLAFPVAALLTGWLAERGFGRRLAGAVAAMLAGEAVIYAGGTLWLAYLLPAGPLGLDQALAAAVYPLGAADLLKVVLAAGVLPAAWAIVGRPDARQ
jgi:biotin transport system substrate-specific component